MTGSLPPPAIALLAATFPAAPIGDLAPTFGGFSHSSALATIGGRRCVVKAASAAPKRADLRREARVLTLLRGSGLPAPPLIGLAEDHEWTVEALGFAEGAHGLRILADAPAELPRVYADLGRRLATLHHAPIAMPSPDLLLAERAGAALAALPGLGLDDELHDELAAALAHPAWHPVAPVLVHGDAGLHNVLWQGGIAALLDWEWAGWGSPLLDLAWVRWTMRWRGVAGALWQGFLEAYGCDCPPDRATLRALALGQIAGILLRVQGDAGARAEWLRRAHWTLIHSYGTGS